MVTGTAFSFLGLTLVEKLGEENASLSVLLQDLHELRVSFVQLLLPIDDYLMPGADANQKEEFEELLVVTKQNFLNVQSVLLASPELKKYADSPVEDLTLSEHVPETIRMIEALSKEIFSLPNPIGNPRGGEMMELADDEAGLAVDHLGMVIEQIEGDQNDKTTRARNTRTFINIVLAIALVVAIIICFTLMFFVYKAFINPLQRLLAVIGDIKAGKSSERATVVGNDEIGLLCQSFNEMTDDLQNSNKKLEDEVAKKNC